MTGTYTNVHLLQRIWGNKDEIHLLWCVDINMIVLYHLFTYSLSNRSSSWFLSCFITVSIFLIHIFVFTVILVKLLSTFTRVEFTSNSQDNRRQCALILSQITNRMNAEEKDKIWVTSLTSIPFQYKHLHRCGLSH